ncbi:MAG TPA: TIGR00730 family Rossman fold protein [Holophaga sp.]|nr:TIGR00730 family Rossman fold protein [Holophaga sp.]
MSGHLCVFTGSSPARDPGHRALARELGLAMARRRIRLVYGGGNCGLMGVVADAVLEGGGEVTGVIPRALVARERAHQGLTELIVTEDMHARKARMVALSDAFLALPGGFGTLDELFEVTTWRQLGIHRKPIGLLDRNGFWMGLLAFLDHAAEAGFIGSDGPHLLHGDDAEAVLDQLFA